MKRKLESYFLPWLRLLPAEFSPYLGMGCCPWGWPSRLAPVTLRRAWRLDYTAGVFYSCVVVFESRYYINPDEQSIFKRQLFVLWSPHWVNVVSGLGKYSQEKWLDLVSWQSSWGVWFYVNGLHLKMDTWGRCQDSLYLSRLEALQLQSSCCSLFLVSD